MGGKLLKVKVFAILLVCTLMVIPSMAHAGPADDGPRSRNAYENLSKKRMSLYRAATYVFWNSRNELKGRGYEADCLPKDVDIRYYRKEEGVVAYTDNALESHGWQALRDVYKIDYLDYSGKDAEKMHWAYCKIWWNTYYKVRVSKWEGCTVLIHEYGHLLGKDHNDNIFSPMYLGWMQYEDFGVQHKLWVRNKANTLGKSVCNADIIGNGRT